MERQIALTQPDYFPEETESEKLNMEKQKLRRRLNDIEAQEDLVDPEIIAQKKQALHFAVARHKREKRISNEILNQTFSQMQVTGEKYPFRENKK